MAEDRRVEDIPVEDVRAGDILAMTADTDPRPQFFVVESARRVDSVATGSEPRIVLTSAAVGDSGRPGVLEYPSGTLVRRVVGEA